MPCDCNTNHLYAVSFTVGSDAGLALVVARNSNDAFQILKNSGEKNGSEYTLIQTRDIGITAVCSYGLILESYVNALTAYAAIEQAANALVGPRGLTGKDGLSAYEIAVRNGYKGTEQEWIISIGNVPENVALLGDVVETVDIDW